MCTNSFPINGRGIYYTPRCRQRAFRLRHHQANRPTRIDLATRLRREQRLIDQTVYECSTCQERSLTKDVATDAICGVESWDSAAAAPAATMSSL